MSDATASRVALGRALVEQAGAAALGYFRAADLAREAKGPGDIVTAADFAIERAIRGAIAEKFAEDLIVGEEFGGEASRDGFTWLIDPVDGTVNFARRLGYFCVSLALLRAGEPVAAWVLDPAHDELFWAGPDGCAFLGEAPIHCARQADMVEAVVGLGFSRRHERNLAGLIVDGLAESGAEFRRLGAGALCLAHVAAGRLDAYVEPHMNPWDAVGGLYIAACAGAVTLDYCEAGGLANGAPVFACNPAIAETLLALLPAPFSGTPPHLDSDQRSAGEAAT